MIESQLLLVAGLAEAGALLVLALTALARAGSERIAQRRAEPAIAAARREVAAFLAGGAASAPAASALRALRERRALQVVADAHRHADERARERLGVLGRESGLAARAEARCASRRWTRRLQAARVLTLLGAGQGTVPALLDDPRPEVRAQAAEWVAHHPDPGSVARLVGLLEDERDLCRFAVMDALLRIGRGAAASLARHLGGVSGSAAERPLKVAIGMPNPLFLTAALRLTRDESAATRALAATLAGTLGGPAAVAAVTEMLADPAAEVRAAAARALGRLGHWPAAAPLAGLLHDGDWDARREAALALRALGAPGMLFLRRALTDADRPARDMARQALDLPATVTAAG